MAFSNDLDVVGDLKVNGSSYTTMLQGKVRIASTDTGTISNEVEIGSGDSANKWMDFHCATSYNCGITFTVGSYQTGVWSDTGLEVVVGSNFQPVNDNSEDLGHSSYRWADVKAVLVQGSDIGFANGWILRELGATAEDIGNPNEWFRENCPDGVKLLNQAGEAVAVFHRNGNLYVAGDVLPISELRGI
jgi:hypothetical protein